MAGRWWPWFDIFLLLLIFVPFLLRSNLFPPCKISLLFHMLPVTKVWFPGLCSSLYYKVMGLIRKGDWMGAGELLKEVWWIDESFIFTFHKNSFYNRGPLTSILPSEHILLLSGLFYFQLFSTKSKVKNTLCSFVQLRAYPIWTQILPLLISDPVFWSPCVTWFSSISFLF